MISAIIDYNFLKIIHVISSAILFGTGIGIAFFMWWVNRTDDIKAKLFIAKTTVLADFIFTTPSVIIQPITGILLVENIGYSYSELWLLLTYFLYILTGLCWLPVVWIQIELKNILKKAVKANMTNAQIPVRYYKLYKYWFFLGWPAFFSLIVIFWLMIAKPLII